MGEIRLSTSTVRLNKKLLEHLRNVKTKSASGKKTVADCIGEEITTIEKQIGTGKASGQLRLMKFPC